MFSWLIIFILYLPFQVALNPDLLWPGLAWGIDLASSRLLALAFVLVWLIRVIKQKQWLRTKIFNSFQAVLLFFFLFFTGLSVFWAANQAWAWRKWLFLLCLIPLFWLFFDLINSLQRARQVIRALLWGAGVMALIGLFQFLGQFAFSLERVYRFWAENILFVFSGLHLGQLILAFPSWLVNIQGQTFLRAFSLFSDPHVFSIYLGLLLPLSLAWLAQPTKPFSLILPLLAYGLFLAALFFSFSRGAYLALLVTCLLLITLILYQPFKKKLILLLIIPLLVLVVPGSLISARFYSSFDLTEGSNLGRLAMWQRAYHLAEENLWSGLGLGNYSLGLGQDYRNPITAHNLYLDIFSETGLFGLIAWLALIGGTLIQLARAMSRAGPALRPWLIGLLAGLSHFSLQSFFETSIYQPVVLVVLILCLALASRLIHLVQSHAD